MWFALGVFALSLVWGTDVYAQPGSVCSLPEVRSPAVVNRYNRGDAEHQVVSVNESVPASWITAPQTFPGPIACHLTLWFTGGRWATGVAFFYAYPGTGISMTGWQADPAASKAVDVTDLTRRFAGTSDRRVRMDVARNLFAVDPARSCVIAGGPDALDRCGIDPSSPAAYGAMNFLASPSIDLTGGPFGRRPPSFTPWARAHCTPTLGGGYRCEWKGLELEYR